MTPDQIRTEFPTHLLTRGPALRILGKCGISQLTARNWISTGVLTAVRVPGSRWQRYRREQIIELLTQLTHTQSKK